MATTTHFIGLIPAAGQATRMGDLPFSKELLPLANKSDVPQDTGSVPAVAIDFALAALSEAGVAETCIVIAPGKWDIPEHTGDGSRSGQAIAYVLAEASPSVPASLDKARVLTRERQVVLLFPDIVFTPRTALQSIVAKSQESDADLILALVPASSGEKIDIVSVADDGLVQAVTPKPGKEHSGWTWVAATWNPEFSAFLHTMARNVSDIAEREMYVADVINAAIDSGLCIRALAFPDGQSFDLGTPDELHEFWNSAYALPA
jgi:glucose-1-phosphate thymidylyltransferase